VIQQQITMSVTKRELEENTPPTTGGKASKTADSDASGAVAEKKPANRGAKKKR
jgi:hypothetical protein